MNDLILSLRLLARTRGIKAEIDADWKALNDRVKKAKKYKQLKADRKRYADFVTGYEGDVRAAALELYDGENKEVTEGVNIQDKTDVTIDAQGALEWARENMPAAIIETVDLDLIKTYAEALEKRGESLAFVTVNEYQVATIKRDLSFILDDTDDDEQ